MISRIYGGGFELDQEKIRLNEIEGKINQPGFWDDYKQAQETVEQFKSLKQDSELFENIKVNLDELVELGKLLDSDDEDLRAEIETRLSNLKKQYEELEFRKTFNGKYDSYNAIVSIHSGAGGKDAEDFAQMLLRMYLRFFETKGFKAEIIEMKHSEEAGIKRAIVEVKGKHSYGYLKSEKGVHRLVRLSPFNANSLRETSFVLVEVLPDIEVGDADAVVLKPEDLRIDVFRSSGPGGQGVNTTDSAVRITHIPTNIVVTCQAERSQMQNKQKALKILKAKLWEMEEKNRDKEEKKLKGEPIAIEWGSQIRSYVLHPYKMVKDHRTGVETSDVETVLNGNIEMFIEAYLKSHNS